MSFYGIHIPTNKDSGGKTDSKNVFTDKAQAFTMLKNHKEARLKVFKTNEDATDFAENGFEVFPSGTAQCMNVVASPPIVADVALFRGPKSQELVLFRKLIEEGKLDKVKETIWHNPRYLIGSGDTPTILKESVRYNALHVAALAKKPKMCELILQSIGDPAFIQLLHGKKDPKICQEVSNILLDLYLNMPEKGRSETPLHLAIKFGATEVVEMLTSYPQCIITPNSEGQWPKDIICSRVDKPDKDTINQIQGLLEERFYVPVIRALDNSTPPIIGEPFSPTNPPNLNFDPLTPEMEIQAYAGPMNKEQAQVFRRRWKTPPRVNSTSPNGSPGTSPHRSAYLSPVHLKKFTPLNTTISSTPKSVDKRGARQLFPNISHESNLQNNNNSYTSEHGTIDNNLIDKNTADMNDNNSNNIHNTKDDVLKIDLFRNYRDKNCLSESLDDSLMNCSRNNDNPFESPFNERHMKLADVEKGLEVIGRELAKNQNIKWKEYWSFLGEFTDITSEEGLQKLENHLRKTSEYKMLDMFLKDHNNKMKETSMNSLCSELSKLEFKEQKISYLTSRNNDIPYKFNKNIEQIPMAPPTSPNAFSAYLCAEKSCQVYAKRMTKIILQNISSVVSINDSLKLELKRLKSLICSYKQDGRFFAVNFAATHSRFASLIVTYLKGESICDLNQVETCLEQINQSIQRLAMDKSNPRNEYITANLQLQCLLKFLIFFIGDEDYTIAPEILTTERDCADIWASEPKCNCSWNVEKSENVRYIRRTARRLDHHQNVQSPLNRFGNDEMRTPLIDEMDCVIDSDDEDVYFSDSGSDNDVYFTPPDSPTQLLETKDFEDSFEGHSNYILGEEPTKTDVDVVNAMLNVEIDKKTYPHIYQWKLAILQHSVEERNNFPSPSIVVKGKKMTKHFPAKRLFHPISPMKKTVRFPHFLKPSSLQLVSNPTDDKSTNLLCSQAAECPNR